MPELSRLRAPGAQQASLVALRWVLLVLLFGILTQEDSLFRSLDWEPRAPQQCFLGPFLLLLMHMSVLPACVPGPCMYYSAFRGQNPPTLDLKTLQLPRGCWEQNPGKATRALNIVFCCCCSFVFFIHYVALAGLEFTVYTRMASHSHRHLLASASLMLGLKAYATLPG